MLGNEKLLFDELYEKTKDCGRVQFVKLLMTKERENQKLKKQLEQYQEEVCILDMRTDENIKYKNQQKEFIKWLENYLELFDYDNIDEQAGYDMIEEILQKYKEIIGVSDEEIKN